MDELCKLLSPKSVEKPKHSGKAEVNKLEKAFATRALHFESYIMSISQYIPICKKDDMNTELEVKSITSECLRISFFEQCCRATMKLRKTIRKNHPKEYYRIYQCRTLGCSKTLLLKGRNTKPYRKTPKKKQTI